jgi:uncharacterized membrane protein (UPF0182 family)
MIGGGLTSFNPMRPRILLLSLAAGIVIALVVLSLADSLLVDLLWFSTLGYRQVFNITISAEVAIFTIVWVVAFLAIWISGMIALRFSRERERLHVVGGQTKCLRSTEASSCAAVLTGTKRIDGRLAASQIASASLASFLLALT